MTSIPFITLSKKLLFNARLPLLFFCIGLIAYKFYLLEINSRAILGCDWCLVRKAIFFELQFLFLLGILHFVAGFSRWYWLRFSLRLSVIAILLIMAIDLIVLQQFLVRFTWHEFLKFVSEFSAIMDFSRQLIVSFWSALIAAMVISIILWVLGRYLILDNATTRSPVFLAFVAFGLFGTEYLKPTEFHGPYLQNSIEAFFSSQTRHRPYSDDFANKILAEPEEESRCYEGVGARPDLILLIVESLSMYHSKLFSGLRDWTPQFDSVSQNGRWFSNFYANAINTEQGLVALLTGEPAIARGTGNASTPLFEQFQSSKHTVPHLLNDLDYYTAFLTTGNLGFLGKGDWLKKIGFNLIEGHDAAYYDGMKRFHFDAAPDQALYDRALIELQTHHRKKPVFLTLETVSTHHPFIDPESAAQSEELVFRYADRALGVFVENLKSIGFFDNGYLMIVSDHRAMVPASQDEMVRFGDRAYARIPFSIIGYGLNNEEVVDPFSQIDLLPSLHHWLSQDRHCVNANQGIFLPKTKHQPACIFTRRSYALDDVFIHCGDEDYIIRLDGDRSHYVGAKPPHDLLGSIHRLRLGKDSSH
ncbi:MAG: sulfatase-like hydrolase/transferase [Nitrosomonas sp.]|nr:sulfatase-like hydrolase/transferase [Nitrosomonas sp.]